VVGETLPYSMVPIFQDIRGIKVRRWAVYCDGQVEYVDRRETLAELYMDAANMGYSRGRRAERNSHASNRQGA
jgi:hypothetical protein